MSVALATMSAAQPQVVAFLTRSGQAVEPNGDVTAVWVDGGDVGAASERAWPGKPPAGAAAEVGQGQRGTRLGVGQHQLAGGGEQVGGREPEPDAVAPVIDQAGRPVSRILGGPAGDQQPGWELPELGRA